MQEKCGTKFQAAKDDGWDGSAWVAMNYSKNHALDIDLTFRQPFTGSDWRAALGNELAPVADALDGVIYYQFGASNYVMAEPLVWTEIG